MSPNVFDIVVIVILAIAAVNGFAKGLIVSAAGLAALLIGVWGALKFSYIFGDFLSQHTHFTDKTISILSFVVVFILIVIGVNMIGKLLQAIVESVDLGMWDKVFGIAFGVLKAAFIISVLIAVFNAYRPETKIVKPETKEKSLFYKYLSPLAPKIFKQLDFNFDKLGIDLEKEDPSTPAGTQI